MKIAIITDLEGVSGVINVQDWLSPNGRYYEKGRMLLTREVNAAITGFSKAGANTYFVIDGHGHGAIDALQLDERALYSRGWDGYFKFGLDGNFDAVAWVGQHAKAGTEKAHIPHTGSHSVRELRINGISLGEFGELAAVAGYYGIPAIFGSGDAAFAKEAAALIPGIHTVAVKEGVEQGDGDECSVEEYEKRNLGAVHIHPEYARQRIREGAEKALLEFKQYPQKFTPFRIAPPYKLEIWYREVRGESRKKEIRRHPTDLIKMFSAEAEIVYDSCGALPERG